MPGLEAACCICYMLAVRWTLYDRRNSGVQTLKRSFWVLSLGSGRHLCSVQDLLIFVPWDPVNSSRDQSIDTSYIEKGWTSPQRKKEPELIVLYVFFFLSDAQQKRNGWYCTSTARAHE
ncbi:hypothetical protein H107_08478 [Trichophyton rubrum CBS 202.88]|nr:hypothetical protein H107_08478 [Trichophyton rubrum CBS 202.88]